MILRRPVLPYRAACPYHPAGRHRRTLRGNLLSRCHQSAHAQTLTSPHSRARVECYGKPAPHAPCGGWHGGAGAQLWKGGMHGKNLCQHRTPASASIIGRHHQLCGYHDNLSRAYAPDVPALRPYPQRVLAVFPALASIGQHRRYLAALPICTPEYTL